MCAQLCLTLFVPLDSTNQAPLSMGFPRQGYWSGLPFPTPGDLPDPRIEPVSPASPVWHVDSLPLSYLGSPKYIDRIPQYCVSYV